MNAKKAYRYLQLLFLIAIISSIVIVRYAAGWLAESSKELSALRAEQRSLEATWTDLENAKQTLTEQAEQVKTLGYVLPVDKDQARVVKEIYAIANQANVSIESVSFPSSTLGSTPTKTTTATTETAPATGQQGESSTTTETAPKPATKSVSQATPIKDIPGVQSIDVSLGVITSKDTSIKGVRYDEMIKLLQLIERNRRTIQIRSVGIGQTINPNGIPSYDLTLSLVIFIKP